jgi:hypothetical protein
VELNIASLESEAAQEVLPTTLPVLVKYRRDLDKSLAALKELRPVQKTGG